MDFQGPETTGRSWASVGCWGGTPEHAEQQLTRGEANSAGAAAPLQPCTAPARGAGKQGLGAMRGSILPSGGSSQVNQLCVVTNTRYPEGTKPERAICVAVAAKRHLEGLQQSRATRHPAVTDTCPAAAPAACQRWHLKRRLRGHDVGRAGGQRLFLTGPAGPAPVTPALGTVLLEVASWPGEGEDNCAGRALDHHSEENGAPKPSSYRVDSKGRSGHSASARR